MAQESFFEKILWNSYGVSGKYPKISLFQSFPSVKFKSLPRSTSLSSRRLEVVGARKNGACEGDTRVYLPSGGASLCRPLQEEPPALKIGQI